MPGVADAVRKTGLKQEKKARQDDITQLITLIQEGRLHEADERQLENLIMIQELKDIIEQRPARETVTAKMEETTSPVAGMSPKELAEVIKSAVNAAMQGLPANAAGGATLDSARPKMGHTSLVDLGQSSDEIKISNEGDLGEEKTGEDDSAGKLERLRKLKGG